MEFRLNRTYMGHSNVHNKRDLQKYPKCISCGQMFKKGDTDNGGTGMQIVFYGSVKDSKSRPLWEFEIICEATVTKNDIRSDEAKQVNDFMIVCYTESVKVFESFISNDLVLSAYSLCPEDNFSVSPHFF